MRILSIICGIAVLLTTLHLGHAVHHFYQMGSQLGPHGLALWGSMAIAVVVWILSFIGGCMLVIRGR